MTIQELQDFAQEIGTEVDYCPVRLTLRRDSVVSITIPLGDRTYNRSKIARLFIDKIDSVFGASDDLLKVREQLEQIK